MVRAMCVVRLLFVALTFNKLLCGRHVSVTQLGPSDTVISQVQCLMQSTSPRTRILGEEDYNIIPFSFGFYCRH